MDRRRSGSYLRNPVRESIMVLHQDEEKDKSENIFLTFVSKMEGWKTRCKNLHWSAPNLNIHEKLDEFLDVLCDYQDKLAEGYMGILGKMTPDAVKPVECSASDAISFINTVRDETVKFNKDIPTDSLYSGIKSDNDAFIQDINKFVYLFSLCGV